MKFGVIFGGISYEHEISIVSAISLNKIFNSEQIYIFIDKEREFYLIPPKMMKSKTFASGDYKSFDKIILKNGGFYKKSFLFGESAIEFDIALNLIHGGDGEDGKIASLFEFFKIPFIGPKIDASVLSFDKHLTKMYAKEIGVDTLPYMILKKDEDIKDDISFPAIIKPLRLGSSIGVSVAKDKESLNYALDVAFEFDNSAICEPFIEGIKEYNLAGCKVGNEYIFSIIEEPEKKELLDFDKKYLDFSRTGKIVEAKIKDELQESIKEAFKKVYEERFEGALIRCDFFVKDGKVYLNEINPVPGSMANYLFENFEESIFKLAASLPKRREIAVEYRYIDKLQAAKGK